MGRPPKQVKLVCRECSNEFFVKAYRAAMAKFCSNECLGKRRRNSVPTITGQCKRCGETYSRKAYEKNGGYCTRLCYRTHSSELGIGPTLETKDCLRCGRSFTAPVWANQRFCSMVCAKTKERQAIVCLYCEKTVDNLRPAHAAERLFCSNRCALDYRNRGGSNHRHFCIDGHQVRSKYEVLVDDWLFNRGIAHAYESPVEGIGFCDWRIGANTYIELWGEYDLGDREAYEKRVEAKRSKYATTGHELIQLRPADLDHLDEVLGHFLKK